MIVVLMAYLWLRRRKNALDRPIGVQTSGAPLKRGWGGLGSFSSIHSTRPDKRTRASRDLTPATRSTGHRLTTSAASFGAGLPEDDEPRSGNSTPFSPSVEKFSNSSALYTNPFDDAEGGLALATLPSNGGRPISSSKTSLHQVGSSPPPLHSSSVDSFTYSHDPSIGHGRSYSTDTSPHLQHSITPPLMEMTRSYSVSSSGAHSTDVSLQQQKSINRQSLGSQSAMARKTPRKPVPVYDPSPTSPSTNTVGSSTPSVHASPATPTSTFSPFGNPTNQGHYSKKSQQSSSGNDSNGLTHKSSFGPGGIEGKPVHYLIPDMPPTHKG
ncbi:hypothetical protein AN958_11967 [Leucoagaricus sp. SymC.cos]|nr:hypothetical protein AN958_11967 [Leucoagaricus sp. SymC.cos]